LRIKKSLEKFVSRHPELVIIPASALPAAVSAYVGDPRGMVIFGGLPIAEAVGLGGYAALKKFSKRKLKKVM
jgi:hypothetical protein